MSEPVEIRVREGDCPCPGHPHAFEIVYVEPRLTNPIAVGAMSALEDAPAYQPAVLARLTEVYLALGIRRWTFQRAVADEAGAVTGSEMIPISPASIEDCIPWASGGREVANQLDKLYSADLFRPLAVARSTSSPPTPMEPSMSRIPASGSTHRKRSRRSSPNGTAGMRSVVPAR